MDKTNLIFVDLRFFQFFLSLILKSNDNQSDENIHEEKGKNDEIHHVENRDF